MSSSVPHQRRSLNEHFVAVPLDTDQRASVRLSLLVRKEADPAEGPFCRIRQLTDANVFLGCYIDGSGHVLKWLELWVRDYDNIAESLHEHAFDIINNSVLDARWERQRKVLGLSRASHVYTTALDDQMDCPLYIDLYKKAPVLPLDESTKTHWKICREDTLLERLELAPYSKTIHRYLYLEALGADSDFLPVTPNAPENTKTQSLDRTISARSTLLPFNRYGGSILVREISLMTVEGYLKVLSGQAWDGVGQGRRNLVPPGVYAEIEDPVTVGYAAGRLVASRPGSRSWLLESLYLKVSLYHEMVTLVKRCVELDKKPFFALETSSFGLSLPNLSPSSPYLWDAEVAINQISDAVDFSVEKHTELDTQETTYFRTFRPLTASLYRPEALGQHRSFMGEVTLLKLQRDRQSGLHEIEGALRSPDIQDMGLIGRNFYFIDYPIRGRRLRLVAEMTGLDPQLADKIRFKTRKVALNSESQMTLESFIGVEQAGVYCEVLPVLGTPCDLYSLGVIGLEVLFDGCGSSLAQLKDQVRTLALACLEMDETTSLVERVVEVLEREPALRENLMPEVLGVGSKGKVRLGLPPEDHIWESLIVIVMRMLSGWLKHESYCEHLSNENNFRLAHVFDEPLRDLSRLMAVLRSLNTGDIHTTQLIRKVLNNMIAEMGGKDNA